MSFKASGTLKTILSLCFALSSTIAPVAAAPTSASQLTSWTPRSLKSLFEPRTANPCGGVGIMLTNNGATKSFGFFTGESDDGVTGRAAVTVASGKTQFVSLPSGWAGHIQRGSLLPATFVEVNMVGTAWGDISLQQGCDGAATIASTDGVNHDLGGFTNNINEGAPAAAYFNPKTQGGAKLTTATNVLDTGVGNWWPPQAPNAAANTWELAKVPGGVQKAFIGPGDVNTTPQVVSTNDCLAVTFY